MSFRSVGSSNEKVLNQFVMDATRKVTARVQKNE